MTQRITDERLNEIVDQCHMGLPLTAISYGKEVVDIISDLQDARVEIARVSNVVNLYDKAADKFIEKVETGRAKSRETYSDLRAVRQKLHEVFPRDGES